MVPFITGWRGSILTTAGVQKLATVTIESVRTLLEEGPNMQQAGNDPRLPRAAIESVIGAPVHQKYGSTSASPIRRTKLGVTSIPTGVQRLAWGCGCRADHVPFSGGLFEWFRCPSHETLDP